MNIQLINKTITITDGHVIYTLREADLVNISLRPQYILLETNQGGTPAEIRIYSDYVESPTHSTLSGLFTILLSWYNMVKYETFLDREIIGTSRTLTDVEVMKTLINNQGQGEANINMTLPPPIQGYEFKVQATEMSANYLAITSTGNLIVNGTAADVAVLATPAVGNYFKVIALKTVPSPDNFITAPLLAMSTSDHTKAHTPAFSYYIAGVKYAVAAGDLSCGTDVIPKGKYGCVAFDVDATGVVVPTSATGNATGYATVELAIAGLPTVVAGFIRLGYVTAIGLNETGGSAFTFSTTALNAAHTSVSFTSASTYIPVYKYIVTTGQGTITTTLPS